MEDKGFYIAQEQVDEVGFSVALVYIRKNKDLQFSIMIFNLMIAIGYVF